MSEKRANLYNPILTKEKTFGGKSARLSSFTFAHYSIACERHPERNEDRVIADEPRGIAAVFDGVGGSAAGEIASLIAAHSTLQGWHHALKHIQKDRREPGLLEDCGRADLCAILKKLVSDADEQVRTQGMQRA